MLQVAAGLTLLQHDQHNSCDHPVPKNPECCFFERDVAEAGKADCQDGCAPKMKQVYGFEDLVKGSTMIEFGDEE